MLSSWIHIGRELWRRSTALDRLTAGYVLAFAVALAFRGRGTPGWMALFVAHILIFVSIGLSVWFWHMRETGFAGFIRSIYPVILYSLFYRELEIADFWVLSQFQDQHVIAFERAIFGIAPNLWIARAQPAWANEIMMAGYFSYYLLIPLASLSLFFRRQNAELRGMLYATTAAFVFSYIGFVLFPVEGPRYFFADQFSAPLSGRFFVPIVGYIIDHGAIRGGCMPSSHVAVALVTLFWMRRCIPRLGAILTPIVLVLMIGTAWGRFHYVTDVFAGIIVGVAALALTGFWQAAKSSTAQMSLMTKGSMRESEAIGERA